MNVKYKRKLLKKQKFAKIILEGLFCKIFFSNAMILKEEVYTYAFEDPHCLL